MCSPAPECVSYLVILADFSSGRDSPWDSSVFCNSYMAPVKPSISLLQHQHKLASCLPPSEIWNLSHASSLSPWQHSHSTSWRGGDCGRWWGLGVRGWFWGERGWRYPPLKASLHSTFSFIPVFPVAPAGSDFFSEAKIPPGKLDGFFRGSWKKKILLS